MNKENRRFFLAILCGAALGGTPILVNAIGDLVIQYRKDNDAQLRQIQETQNNSSSANPIHEKK